MNSNTMRLLFALLRSAVCGENIHDEERALYSFDELQNLFNIAQSHDLAHLLALALKNNGISADGEIGRKFESEMLKAIYRQEVQSRELSRTCGVLENAKIPFVPLKGSVICDYYPEPWMRTSCDIDILVKEYDVEKAIDCLCGAGYERIADNTTYDYGFLSPNKTHIELHYKLEQAKMPKVNAVLNCVWDEVTAKADRAYQYVMTFEFFLFYHIAHMAKHLVKGGCGIRPFVDLWLLEDKMPYDAEKLKRLLEKAGLQEFYDTARSLCRMWFEKAECTGKTKLLSDYILLGGVYGTVQNGAQIKAAEGESKMKSFLNLAFLPKEKLTIMYPKLKKHPYLFPFYQAKRWLRIFRKSKRDKIKNLTSVRNGVSENEEMLAKDMLKQIGLAEKL